MLIMPPNDYLSDHEKGATIACYQESLHLKDIQKKLFAALRLYLELRIPICAVRPKKLCRNVKNILDTNIRGVINRA